MPQAGSRDGFSKCPREIRDLIYHNLWKETPFMAVAWNTSGKSKGIPRIGTVITAVYDSWPDRQNGRSASALTSRLVDLALLTCVSL